MIECSGFSRLTGPASSSIKLVALLSIFNYSFCLTNLSWLDSILHKTNRSYRPERLEFLLLNL